MQMRLRQSAVLLLTISSALNACGGGGGGSPPASSPRVNQSPVAALTASPSSGGAPLLVTFDASASRDPDGNIVRYRWNFGDGSPPASGVVASHSFDQSGSYVVTLTVIDNDGGRGSHTIDIDVTPGGAGFTLSGRIRILASSAVDSDVNDVGTTPVANDDFSSAQALPNPVAAGGYVNAPNTGAPGNLQTSGDPGDFYRISLTGQESLLLTAGDPQNGDLAMHLWRVSPLELVDSVIVAGNAGSLSAPEAGEFFIEIDVLDGFSTYVLNVGQDVAANLTAASRASDDFVPGQVVVLGTRALPDPSEYRVKARGPTAALLEPRGPRDLHRGIRGARIGGSATAAQLRKWSTLMAVRDLRSVSGRRAEPNYIRRAQRMPNDPFFGYQWHLADIAAPLAWDLPQGTSDAVVAVIDTGVLLAHPDLRNAPGEPQKLLPGYDFISDPARANDGDGPDPNPDDPGDLAFGGASSFHGTHVAGTVAARSDNGIGVAGVAWDALIMPLRVLGVDGGTSFDVTQAILYAAGLDNATGALPARRADIINLSLGSLFSSELEEQAIADARSQGLIIIASAGNAASTTPSYPAAYEGVVAVSATTLSRSLAPYSNRGSWIDVAAPGGNSATDLNGDGLGDGVISTLGDDSGPGAISFGYGGLSGTSMAAPHVAGVVALMKAAHPGLTPAQFDTALIQGQLTDDLGTPGRDDLFGNGLINAQRALSAAFDLANASGNPIPAVLTGSPASLNFGAFDTALPVTIGNAGEGLAAVASVTSSATWLSAVADTVDADGLGTYLLQVDRTGLADGTYNGSVRFAAQSSEFSVSVVMQQTSLDITADAGPHYVVLVDATTDRSIRSVAASALNGEYRFEFTDVASGQYQVFAGTDLDNDNFICDGGEACGAFRTLDSPDIVPINADRADLDFVSGYRINLFPSAANAGMSATTASTDRGPLGPVSRQVPAGAP